MLTILELAFQYIGLIISFVFALIILSGRREARATLAWLMVVIFFPYIGAILYILFGNYRLKKIVERKIKDSKKIHVTQYHSHLPEYEQNKFGKIIEHITGLEPFLCSKMELLPSAIEKYSKLFQDITNAKNYILLEYYVFRQDDVGKFLIKLLTKKAREGVKVFLIYDGIGAIGLTLKKTLNPLIKAGGKCVPFLSPLSFKTFSRVNFRNHRKIAIIDGEVCYTGGINIGNEYVGNLFNYQKWYDAHIRFKGNGVKFVEEIFAEDWYFITKEDITEIFNKKEIKGGDTTVHIIPSGPDQESPYIYDTLFTVFNQAEKSIEIVTPYLVPDPPIMESLKNAAKRGVLVKLLLPGRNNHPMVAAAGRSYYEELLTAGVKIYEMKDIMLHAKIIKVDDNWVTVGSANLDIRSFRLNFELNVIIYSSDFSYQITQLFSYYLNMAKEINYEYVTNRPFSVRIFEGLCRTLSPVL
ncbi:cardiolipin synthase [Deferribacter abyssi]|uniref:cardiolipin synthase n=1 Tax=Deferribacter abyssi TaxID=213806 RepID=UPI003C191026